MSALGKFGSNIIVLNWEKILFHIGNCFILDFIDIDCVASVVLNHGGGQLKCGML